MNIDLTDAARAMGVKEVPTVEIGGYYIYEPWEAQASYFTRFASINATPGLLDYNTDDAERLRQELIRRQRMPELRGLNFVRWVFAHELGHRLQDEQGHTEHMRQINALINDGVIHHDASPYEKDADRLARLHWRHVKINGHGPRGGAR